MRPSAMRELFPDLDPSEWPAGTGEPYLQRLFAGKQLTPARVPKDRSITAVQPLRNSVAGRWLNFRVSPS